MAKTSTFRQRLSRPLITAAVCLAVILMSQALSFAMPTDDGESATRFLRQHAVLIGLAGVGVSALSLAAFDVLDRLARLEKAISERGKSQP